MAFAPLQAIIKSGEIYDYRQLVKQQLSGLISHACSEGLEDIEAAISHLSDTLKDAAAKLIPEMSYKKHCNQLFQHFVLKEELPG